MPTHKHLEVWKQGMELAKEVYQLTAGFPASELYGLVAQMRCSAVSVASNIAEGAARNTDKDLIHFLYILLAPLPSLTRSISCRKSCA
jgi:four helix bundle protein